MWCSLRGPSTFIWIGRLKEDVKVTTRGSTLVTNWYVKIDNEYERESHRFFIVLDKEGRPIVQEVLTDVEPEVHKKRAFEEIVSFEKIAKRIENAKDGVFIIPVATMIGHDNEKKCESVARTYGMLLANSDNWTLSVVDELEKMGWGMKGISEFVREKLQGV